LSGNYPDATPCPSQFAKAMPCVFHMSTLYRLRAAMPQMGLIYLLFAAEKR
jgi:hypothetical protein